MQLREAEQNMLCQQTMQIKFYLTVKFSLHAYCVLLMKKIYYLVT